MKNKKTKHEYITISLLMTVLLGIGLILDPIQMLSDRNSDSDSEHISNDYRLYLFVFLLAIFFRVIFFVYIEKGSRWKIT